MKFHEIADIFPLMDDASMARLVTDVIANGFREPIMTFEDKVLDGRNRYLASKKATVIAAGRQPTFEAFKGSAAEALAYSWSMNRERRQLNSSQLAIADAKRAKLDARFVEALKREAKKRQSEGGGDKKSKAAKSVSQKIDEPINGNANKTAAHRAAAAGTNRQYVSDADRIVRERPDLAKLIEAGDMTIPQAKVAIRREEKKQELNEKAKQAEANQADCSWQLIEGDSAIMLDGVEAGTCRLVFADPPYNIGIDYGEGTKADKLPDEKYLDWCRTWMAKCVEKLTADGSMWVLIGDEYADHFGILLREVGLHRRAWIKWYETFGVNQANNFNRCSRHLFYCVKDTKQFVFHAAAVNRPSDRQTKYGDSRADPAGKIWDDVWEIPRLVGTAKERIPEFPTQLPLELVSPIVECASDPGDTVLDPFNGSATTGVAAITSGRKYIGIEKSKEFLGWARKRLLAESISSTNNATRNGGRL